MAFGNWGALPWMIGSLVEGAGFAPDRAAFLGAFELTLMGTVMLAMAPRVPRMNRARLVGFALPLILAAQIASAFVTNYYFLLMVRGISGAAFGAIFSVGTAEGADAEEPDRVFAFATVLAMCCGMVKSPMLGYAKELFGYRGVFLSLSVYYMLIGLPLYILLMRGSGEAAAARARPATSAPAPRMLPAIGVLLVMSAFSIATGGVYAFVERVANGVGISASALGRGFAVAALIGTLGGTAAGRLGLRVGRMAPTIGGMVLLGVLCYFVMSAPTRSAFWVSYALWVIVHWFSYSYIMGLSVMVDAPGRIATLTSATYILTGAAGATFAGLLTRYAGLSSYGWAALAACLTGAAIAGWVLRAIAKASTPPATQAMSAKIP